MRFIIPALLVLVACTGEVEPTDDVVQPESAKDRLYRYLIGTFDSNAQSISNPAYFDIRMVICEASAPTLGSDVLYLEQAQATDLDNPYRQRLYVIEAGDEENTAVSRIFTFSNPQAAVGACEDGSKLPGGIGAAEKAGCEVTLTWDDATGFTGGTSGTDCPTELGGDYATSEVTLTEAELTSWDRGFFDSGDQAWGATQGAYIFERRTDLVAE